MYQDNETLATKMLSFAHKKTFIAVSISALCALSLVACGAKTEAPASASPAAGNTAGNTAGQSAAPPAAAPTTASPASGGNSNTAAANSGAGVAGAGANPGAAGPGNAGAPGAPGAAAGAGTGGNPGPGGAEAGKAGAPAAAAGPPVSITSVRAQQKDLPIFLQATGAVTPVSSVDVRSQMTSVVTKVHIKEGQFVRKGELLFTLDARPDEANVTKAQAQVAKSLAQIAKDESALAETQRQLARSKQLVEKNFVSQGAVDTAQSNVDAQNAVIAADKAALDADKAALASARIPLTYSRIVAPGSGRIGTISVFTGSAVQANQTPMVTITQLDPIAVAFNLPQRNLSSVLAILKSGGALVRVTFPESNKSVDGKLSFVDTNVDTNSGTVKAKALFENRDQALWPGAFVNVSVQIEAIKDAIVIPQATVIQTIRGSIVYVIDKENKASVRPVQIVQSHGEEAAVTGLKPGERIALDGRQNLRPGSTAMERPRDGAGKGAGKGSEKGGADKGAADKGAADKGAADKAIAGKGNAEKSSSDKGGDKSAGKPSEKSGEKPTEKAKP
jgi:RND family efflux transporter MFP subunit